MRQVLRLGLAIIFANATLTAPSLTHGIMQ